MKDKAKILVVEDVDTVREIYATTISGAGHHVDTARNLQEAVEKINRLTYDVAVVDIRLGGPNDTDNDDGIKILSHIRFLSEGTLSIVLSAEESPQLSADMVQTNGAFRFLSKRTLISGGSRVLLENIDLALANVSIDRHGGKDNILDFLRGPIKEDIWIETCLTRLSPRGGYQGFRDFFDHFLNGLLPLVPSAQSEPEGPWFKPANEDNNAPFVGSFWSKGMGAPLYLTVSNETREGRTSPHWLQAEPLPIREHSRSGLIGRATLLSNKDRDTFLTTTREVTK